MTYGVWSGWQAESRVQAAATSEQPAGIGELEQLERGAIVLHLQAASGNGKLREF